MHYVCNWEALPYWEKNDKGRRGQSLKFIAEFIAETRVDTTKVAKKDYGNVAKYLYPVGQQELNLNCKHYRI